MCHYVPPPCAPCAGQCATTMCSHTSLRRSTPPVSWMAMAYHHTLSYHTILHHMCLCFDCYVIPYHRITWLRPPYNEKPVSIQVNTREKYELLWFAALWQRYCQHFYGVSSQTLCQTTQNRTTHYTVNLDQDMHNAGSRQQRPAASAPNTWLSFSSSLYWAQIALFPHGGRTTQCVQCNLEQIFATMVSTTTSPAGWLHPSTCTWTC